MTRVICCNRFLSQSVLSPDWPVGCLCCHDNNLIVSSGPRQLTIFDWIDDQDGGRQLRECGQVDTGLPVIQVRCCPISGLLVALCSAEQSERGTSSSGTVCQAYLNWKRDQNPILRHNFADHRRANLIRVDADRVAIAEARTLSIYGLKAGLNTNADSFQLDGFELVTVLQLDFVLTQLEIKNYSTGLCLLAAAANRMLLLQLQPRPLLLMNQTDCPQTAAALDNDGGNVFSLFDFEEFPINNDSEETKSQQANKSIIRLDSKPKERLFPDTKSVCRVAFSHPSQLIAKTWLLKTQSLQGEDRLHSLELWNFDSTNFMTFFSTQSQGFLYCLNSARNLIEKLMELRYNSVVLSAVIGADGLLHTMSTDLVESYTTHQPLCRLSSSIASVANNSANVDNSVSVVSSAVPNLLIGSQMFPGIITIAAHESGLLLVSSASDADEPTGGRLLSTLYTLVFESAANLVEDLIDKCLAFKQDSEDIFMHLASEAAFLLQTSKSANHASDSQRRKLIQFCADLVKDHPDDCIAARLMLDYLHPNLDVFLPAASLDPAKLLQSSSLVGYIRDQLLHQSGEFSLPDNESAVWSCLEQLLRALLARESAQTSATLLVRLLALLPSDGQIVSRLCSHQLPRLNPGSLLRCLTAFAAGDSVETDDQKFDDTWILLHDSSINGLSEAEICDSLPALAALMPLKQFEVFWQKLFDQQPLAVCAAMETMDRFDWRFARQLPWPLSIYFVEVRWLQRMTDAAANDVTAVDASDSESEADYNAWAQLLVELLSSAVQRCENGSKSCQLPIDVSLSTPDGVLKRLLSVLYNLPSMSSRRCCCLAYVVQRILLLLWIRPSQSPPMGFDSLCDILNSIDPSLATCVSCSPILIGCRQLTANPTPVAQRLLPLLRLAGDTRRRLIGCIQLTHSDWLALGQAAELEDAAKGQSECADAVRTLASQFADQGTAEFLLEGHPKEAELLFSCVSRESLRIRRDELTRLLAGQLAE